MFYLNNIEEEILKYFSLAKEVQERAYVPYSNFRVGAVVVDENGKIYTGNNIENSSYSLTICAERVAIFKAISEGSRDIKTICVIGQTDKPISPCGACRQVISELAPNAVVYLSNRDMSRIIKTNINELLPYQFNLEEDKTNNHEGKKR
uniref:Cytidine deaminase n=1 Tax=Caldicellulosiruptor owensensis TaxID=55205 RepID=A0A7C5V1D3_9FIRM